MYIFNLIAHLNLEPHFRCSVVNIPLVVTIFYTTVKSTISMHFVLLWGNNFLLHYHPTLEYNFNRFAKAHIYIHTNETKINTILYSPGELLIFSFDLLNYILLKVRQSGEEKDLHSAQKSKWVIAWLPMHNFMLYREENSQFSGTENADLKSIHCHHNKELMLIFVNFWLFPLRLW